MGALPEIVSIKLNRINLLAGIFQFEHDEERHAVMTKRLLQLLQEHYEGKDWTDKLEFKRYFEMIEQPPGGRRRQTMIVRALEFICVRSTLYTRAPGEMPYLVYAAMKSAVFIGVPIELMITTALLLYPVP